MKIDTRSLDAFQRTLPQVPETIQWLLAMQTVRTTSAAKRVLQMQSTRGCIGHFPIGRDGELIVALRLLPDVAPEQCPVVHTAAEEVEPITIAPRLEYAVPGRLAQMDAATPVWEITDEMRAALITLAREFGDEGATARVLDHILEARQQIEQRSRSAALFGAIDEMLPWCNVIEGAWSLSEERLLPWVDEAILRFPDDPIVRRLYVVSHVASHTSRDVRDVAWKLIEGDIVYDANYIGAIPGPAFDATEQSALAEAVKVVESDVPLQPSLRRQLWEANHAFVTSPRRYTGEKHLAIAQSLAALDAAAAYTQACNAAACAARSRSRKKRDAIALARRLATKNRWQHIEESLSAI